MLVIGGCVLSAIAGCASSSSHRNSGAQSTLIAPSGAPSGTAARSGNVEPQTTSLLGQPLYPPPMTSEVRAQRQEELDLAQRAYDNDLHDENVIIWLGRRQAYLGEYRAAIDTFSNGLAIMPESYRLLRHRGHRYITLRQFDLAVADLSRAAQLIEGLSDEVEPDGQPNALNIPTSTTNTNIYYHLGLAHYLRGDWPQAADAYARCLNASRNDDMRVAAAYWLYLSQMRAGSASQAAATLRNIPGDMHIIENQSYWTLLQVFKGDLDAGAVQPRTDANGVANDPSIDLATIGYGLGERDLIADDRAAAEKRFREIIAHTNWAAFGHIAAEAELARMHGEQ